MSDILIIPDPHAHPEFDNDRFEVLGNYIASVRPEIIVCMGDFADMYSLSSYDKGTKGFEGRRYKDDIDCARDADNLLWKATEEYNEKAKVDRKKRYRPKAYMVMGNHEDRINRVRNSHPELWDTLSTDDLGFQDRWTIVPFLEVLELHGICFSHYFASGVMGRPIGGMYPAKSVLGKLHTSAVVGHNHLLDFAIDTLPNRRKVFAISAGTYGHPTQIEGWNKSTQHKYWHGVVHLHGVADGWAREFQFLHHDQLVNKWG